MPFAVAAIGTVAAAGISAYVSSSNADKQAKAVQGAADTQAAAQNAQFQQSRSDLQTASERAQGIYGDYNTAANMEAGTGRDNALNWLGSGVRGAKSTLEPYTTTGQSALWQIAGLNGLSGDEAQANARSAFQTSPGYRFQMDEGLKAVDRSAAARGGLLSGRAIKGAETFGSGLAASEYGSYYNRLADLARTGATASGQIAGYQNQSGLAGAGIIANTGQQMGTWDMATAQGKSNALLGAATQDGAWGQTTAQNIANQQNTAAANTASIYGASSANTVNTINGAGNNLLYAYGRGWLGGTPGSGSTSGPSGASADTVLANLRSQYPDGY